MDSRQAVLRAREVSKRFAGVVALDSVSFDVAAGEVHALVGENGAGKSTLMNILTGGFAPDGGTIELDGEPIQFRSPAVALARGIVLVHQEPKLAGPLSVAENIFMGRLPKRSGGRLDKARLHLQAREILDGIGLPLDTRLLVSQLSVAARQFVQVARAVALNARLIALDEPTASLTPIETTQLFDVVRKLKARGTAFVYISHRLDEIFEIADRVSVLKDGAMVASPELATTGKSELIRLMVGRELGSYFPDPIERSIGAVALKADKVAGPGFKDISLELRYGEIVGLAGLIGAGRTELALGLCGATPLHAGELWRDGRRVHLKTAAEGARAGIAYLAEDRSNSVLRPLSIMHNITLAGRNEIARLNVINHAKERAAAREYIDRLHIRSTGVDQLAGQLSGGNQQKCVIARWIMKESGVVIFDEPTRGIDVATKREIYGLIQNLAAEGRAILMISSELPEILGMCDRVLVMQAGRLGGELSRDQATESSILELAVPRAEEEWIHA